MPNPFDNLTDEGLERATAAMPNAGAIAAFGVQADPQKAAAAVGLSNNTGIPAQVISQDPDKFRKQINAQAAGALVNSNPQLREYATSDPMKAQVSAQDWHNLDNYSQAADQVPKQSFWQSWIDKGDPAQKAIATVGQALTTEPEGVDKLNKYLDERIPNGLRWAVKPEDLTGMATVAYQAGAGALAAGGAVLGLGIDTVSDALSRHLGVNPQMVQHELEGMAESEFGRSAVHMEPYFKAKEVPPRGLSPELEAIRKQESTEAVAKIHDAFGAAQASETKALVPEFFKDFAEQHHEQQTIGISVEALEKFYGEEGPKPNDGVLGFLPGAAEQWEVAKETGADIKVPITDMMAHMDPEVFKELEEGIRPFEDGYTKDEEVKTPEVNDARYPDHGIGEVYNGFSSVRTPELMKDTGVKGAFDVPDWYHGLKSTVDGLAEQLGLPTTPRLWVGENANSGRWGYASSDGHIVLNSSLDEHTAVATALHEVGHQVEYQRFRNLVPAEQTAIRDAWRREFGKEQTVGQNRPLSSPPWMRDVNIEATPSQHQTYLRSFPEWFAEQTQRWLTKTEEPRNFVEKFFKGIADAWQKIYDTVRGHTDVVPEMNDFIRGLWGGEKAPLPEISNEPVHIRIYQDPAAIGMSKGHWGRYEKAIQSRFDEEHAANLKRATIEEKKRLAPEWAAKKEELRKEVVDDFNKIPRFVADSAIRNGDVPKFASDALTDEQKATLPRSYYEKNGSLPDNVANRLGYSSGKSLLEDLMDYHKNRGGLNAEEYRRRLINNETERRMERQHGRLEDNAVQAAKERVTKPSALAAMHAEIEAMAGDGAGQMPYTPKQVIANARDKISKMTMNAISSENLRRGVERISKKIEDALLKKDTQAAFGERVRKYIGSVMTAEAERVEKLQTTVERIFKKYDEREGYHKDTQEYTDAMHLIMDKIGEKIPRTLADVTENMRKNGYGSLGEFAKSKFDDGFQGISVPEFLDDPSWKKSIGNMTAAEFEDVHDAVKSLDFAERESRKVYVGAEAMERADFRAAALAQLEELGPAKPFTGHEAPTISKELMKTVKSLGWGLIQIEAVCKRLDRGTNGLFTKAFSRIAIEAANARDRLLLATQDKLLDIEKIPNINEKVPNTLFKVNGQALNFTRRNLLGVLQHMGNADNFTRLTDGWKVDPEAVKAWVAKYTTPEDWQRAQRYGDIFEHLFGEADRMSHATTGVGIRKLDLGVVDNPHQLDGMKGWYNPATYLMDHPDAPDISKESVPFQVVPEGIIGGDYYQANTRQNYTKERTGFRGPINLSLDSVPQVMKQMVHDITMRPALIEMKKLTNDKAIMQGIADHYSETAAKMFKPYVDDMAGKTKVNSPIMNRMNNFFGAFLRNTAMAEIGFKLSTAMKHGTTALTNSIYQVGPEWGYNAATMWMDSPEKGQSWKDFAMDQSDELKRRQRGQTATLALDHGLVIPGAEAGLGQKITALKDSTQRAGTSLIAGLDLGSAIPTWITEFKKQMALDPENMGMAKSLADQAVREAHGSSSYASKPELMRSNNLFAKGLTQFYGFFNEMLNKQYEMMWRAKDAAGYAVNDGDFSRAHKEIVQSSLILARMLTAGVIEEYFTGEGDPHEGLLHKGLRTLGYTFTAPLPYVREMAHAISSDRNVDVGGLMSVAPQSYINVGKDLIGTQAHQKLWSMKFMNDMAMATATASGIPVPGALKVGEYAHGLAVGQEHPKTFPQLVRGFSRGTGDTR